MGLSTAKKKLNKKLKKTKKKFQSAAGGLSSVTLGGTSFNSKSTGDSGTKGSKTKKKKESSDTEAAADQADAAIEEAGGLSPSSGKKLTSLAQVLKAILKELDPNSKNDEGGADDEGNDDDTPELDPVSRAKLDSATQDLEKATAKLAPARAMAKIGGVAVRTATKGAAKLARKGANETSDAEINQAIKDTDKALKKTKNLLAEDAGVLGAALAVLKKALMELAGQDKEQDGDDADEDGAETEKPTSSGSTNNGNSDNPTEQKRKQAEVAKAVDGVQKAQAKIANNRAQRGEPTSDPENPTLNKVKDIDANNLDAEGVSSAIDDVDDAINDSKREPGRGGSLLQGMLYALKMALFELGGVDPKEHEADEDEEKAASNDGKTSTQKINDPQNLSPKDKAIKVAKVNTAINDVKAAESEVRKADLKQGKADRHVLGSAIADIADTPPSEMTEKQLSSAIKAVKKALANGKSMLPENAGLLVGLLHALQKALFDLAGKDPDWQYEEVQEWEAVLEKRQDQKADSLQDDVDQTESVPGSSDSGELPKHKDSKESQDENQDTDHPLDESHKTDDDLESDKAHEVNTNSTDISDQEKEPDTTDVTNTSMVANKLDRRVLETPPSPEKIERVSEALYAVQKEDVRLGKTHSLSDTANEQAELNSVLNTKPDELTEAQVKKALRAVDSMTKKREKAIPDNGGFLGQLLGLLKQALFDLAGKDPDWQYDDQTEDDEDNIENSEQQEDELTMQDSYISEHVDHSEDKLEEVITDSQSNSEGNDELSASVLNTESDEDQSLESSSDDVQNTPDVSPKISPNPVDVKTVIDAINDVSKEQQRLNVQII